MTPTIWLASAGFIATAVKFGPARMGFGLFLPTFREEFVLSTTQAGLIASLAAIMAWRPGVGHDRGCRSRGLPQG